RREKTRRYAAVPDNLPRQAKNLHGGLLSWLIRQLSASETPFPFSILPSHICLNPDNAATRLQGAVRRRPRPRVTRRVVMNRPISVEGLAQRLPAKGRLVGLDLGAKTIGLAVSDVERRLASPLRTLTRRAFQKDADALVALFAEFEIVAIVL